VADLDEDGAPDLLAAFEGGAAGGTVRVHRSREGTRNAAARQSAAVPIDASGDSNDVSIAPELLATGDFDADGHADVALAERGAAFLTLLAGDGTGALGAPTEIPLAGPVDALAAGEVNRSDGLVDLVVAVSTPAGPRLEVFEWPEGALRGTPEEFPLPDRGVAIGIADLDADFVNDIVVATRTSLVIVRGRDRRLGASRAQRAEVPPAVVRSTPLTGVPVAMAVGRFLSHDAIGIAVADEDGTLSVADGTSPERTREVPGRYPGVSLLSSGHVRGGSSDDLIVLERSARKIVLLRPGEDAQISRDVEGEPVSVVGLRLDADALDDLVLLGDAAGANPVATALTSIQSALVVTNGNDSGAGSLRQAILDANNIPGPDSINFNIPGSGVVTILPLSALPPLSGSITLDATTQPGYVGSPLIEIDGTAAGPGADGLTLNLGDNVVRGLDLHGFMGGGIVIDGAGHNVVEACYLGTDPTGAFGIANGDAGLLIRNSHLNTIGGTTAAARNVISGNLQRGVAIFGSLPTPSAFSSSGPGLTICDLCTVSLPINVSLEGGLAYAYATVNIQHTFDRDLRLTLVAPDSTRVLLSEFNGGSGDNYTNTIFDDLAVTPIKMGSAPFSGSYIPEEPLAALNGMPTQGSWSLEVQDAAPGDSGMLSGWSLSFLTISTFGNVIEGNFIGTDATGTSALTSPNGVVIDGAPGNLVGGTAIGARNVISGASGQSAGNGVLISGLLAVQNRVQGNYIGTNGTGAAGIPNLYAGVKISSGSTCLVGGTAPGAGNLISGNGVWGVRTEQSDRIDVVGNLVGTDASGSAALGNGALQTGGAGVAVIDGNATTVGGAVAAARNVISGNAGQQGLTFFDTNSNCCSGNVGIGNFIGTDPSGTLALPNENGVYLRSRSAVVGGAAPGEGNVVAGNAGWGILVWPGSDGTVVAGNIVGLDHTGTSKLGNFVGIDMNDSKSVIIGGAAAGAGNTIAGNLHQGVTVKEACSGNADHPASTDTPKLLPDLATTTSSIVEPLDEPIRDLDVKVNLTHTFDSDLILTLIGPDGTRVTLSNRHGGSGDDYTNTLFEALFASTPISAGSPPFTGTFLADEPLAVFTGQSTMGTWTLEISDVAGGDTGVLWGWSLDFSTDQPANERILGNHIGTNALGAPSLGNMNAGIDVKFACALRIGGSSAGEGNVISGNGGEGIRMFTTSATPSIAVQGNLIGVKPDGITPLGNGGPGVLASGRIGTIGGPTAAAGNVIAFNTGAGVSVVSGGLKEVAIRANSIHDNGGLGIDLDPAGVTPNDSNDADTGANQLQNFPVVADVAPFFNGTLVSGTFSSAPNSKFVVDAYANQIGDPSGHGEGGVWLGSIPVTTDGIGYATWSLFTAATGVHFVTATATDFVGNTSEFSGAFSSPMEASPVGDMTVTPGGGTSLQVSYSPACGATNHVVYWGAAGPGPIGSGGLVWTDAACAMGTSGSTSFDPGTPPSRSVFYFVIVGHNHAQEGSYGASSSSVERPEAVRIAACDQPQILPQACQ
jgi:subtilisin-like proprotein convertase family protein